MKAKVRLVAGSHAVSRLDCSGDSRTADACAVRGTGAPTSSSPLSLPMSMPILEAGPLGGSGGAEIATCME